MDIKGYITSGILELYVHGLANPEEIREVEELAAQHPEVQQEIDAIRQALETYAGLHSVQPPEGLKEKILQRIDGAPKSKSKSKASSEKQHTPAQEPRPRKEGGGISAATVAAWLFGLLFLAAGFATWLFWQQAEKAKAETVAVQAQYDQFKKDFEAKQAKDAQLQEQFIAIRHWATKPVRMKGTKLSEDAFVIVYWNDIKRTSYLDVVKIPEPPSDKQYQLWAIVEGKPADMGVFDLKTDDGGLKTVEFIENAQVFAVTLEPKGGSPVPSFDQMYVIGNVVKG